MNHNEVQQRLTDYIDGRIPDAESIELHLNGCVDCREVLSELRSLDACESALAAEVYQVGPGFNGEVMDKIASYEKGKLLKIVLIAAAVLIAGFLLAPESQAPAGPGGGPLGSYSEANFDDELIRNGVGNAFKLIEGAFGAAFLVGTVLLAAFFCAASFKNRRYLIPAGGFMTVAVLTFVVRSTISLFFGTDYTSYEADGGGYDITSHFPSFSRDTVPYPAYAPEPQAPQHDWRRFEQQPAWKAPVRPAPDPGAGERYGQYEENRRQLTAEHPVSTFSLDVDTGSYANIRRFLSLGQLPPTDAVRIEEMINYFDYRYPVQHEAPFAVHYELAPSPLERERFLLKIGVRAKDAVRNEDAGWNLVFLIDRSGSMADDNKLGLIKQSLKVIVQKMRPVDHLAIVTYASDAREELSSTSGKNKELINQAIDRLTAGGSTNGAAGIDLAYRIAEQNRTNAGVNRVILATDGDFNVGAYTFPELMELIAGKLKSGISLTTLGVGTGNYNEKNLEQLADKGNGNYFYLDSFREAQKVLDKALTGNMETVAEDVKLQVEFNPVQVVEYRLIGYDNRVMKAADFDNDRVDAGEVGSGHTVTALYELVLSGTPLAEHTSARSMRYQTKPAGAARVPEEVAGELGFVRIRFKAPGSSISQLAEEPLRRRALEQAEPSEDFRFAAAVAGFGTLLRHSPYAGSYSFADIAQLARGARGLDPDGDRAEFIGLVEAASRVR